jgi:hypothetical protein
MSEFNLEHTIATFKKNRAGATVRIALATVDDCKLLDVREMRVDEGGTYKATKKGLCVVLSKLDELIAALVKARASAVELGWLEDAHSQRRAA